MLYQLDTTIGLWVVVLDAIVLGLLIYLLKQPGGAPTKLLPILGIVLLGGPLLGVKLLRSAPGIIASTPGPVIIRNPEQRITKLYYLRNSPKGTWWVNWVDYVWAADAECVLEMEGQYGMEVAYKQGGRWYYAPILVDRSFRRELSLPHDFIAVDTSGRIEDAVASHKLSECISWFSILLTIGSAGVLIALIIRFIRSHTSTKILTH